VISQFGDRLHKVHVIALSVSFGKRLRFAVRLGGELL
jgi:hypothetical protein